MPEKFWLFECFYFLFLFLLNGLVFLITIQKICMFHRIKWCYLRNVFDFGFKFDFFLLLLIVCLFV